MSKRRYNPAYAAGVLIRDTEGYILAVSRQPPHKRRQVPHHRYDWGLPAGMANPGEFPFQTAARELEEETGIISPHGLVPLIEVPPLTGRNMPFYVFGPAGPTGGSLKSSTREGAVAWVQPSTLLGVCDSQVSVVESNRYILWGLGLG
jgi:8-oxo-dGTP pyrophosphatase MutT (NUDIX family)